MVSNKRISHDQKAHRLPLNENHLRLPNWLAISEVSLSQVQNQKRSCQLKFCPTVEKKRTMYTRCVSLNVWLFSPNLNICMYIDVELIILYIHIFIMLLCLYTHTFTGTYTCMTWCCPPWINYINVWKIIILMMWYSLSHIFSKIAWNLYRVCRICCDFFSKLQEFRSIGIMHMKLS